VITYLFFILNTFLFTWYSSKLLRDVSGADQYWHYPQMFLLIGFFLMPLAVYSTLKSKAEYLIRVVCWGMMFPFLFNSGLNLYRDLPIQHLGSYDFLNFAQTVALFVLGFLFTIIFEVWKKKNIK
jgi:hypothetical protein